MNLKSDLREDEKGTLPEHEFNLLKKFVEARRTVTFLELVMFLTDQLGYSADYAVKQVKAIVKGKNN